MAGWVRWHKFFPLQSSKRIHNHSNQRKRPAIIKCDAIFNSLCGAIALTVYALVMVFQSAWNIRIDPPDIDLPNRKRRRHSPVVQGNADANSYIWICPVCNYKWDLRRTRRKQGMENRHFCPKCQPE